MPAALECLVERRASYTLVRVVGALDPAGLARIRAVMVKALADQPDALLVELSRVVSCDPAALSVLGAIGREAARWPAIPVVLCAPSASVGAVVRRAEGGALPVFDSVTDAARTVGWGPESPSLVEDLLPVAGAARRVRELVTEACVRWDLPNLAGSACIVASELVNNAVEHAGTIITVRIGLHRRHFHLAVRDGSVQPPVLDGSARPDARGLRLVDAVAGSRGHLITTDGKVVWATLPLGAGDAG
jgi:hypothetical protein